MFRIGINLLVGLAACASMALTTHARAPLEELPRGSSAPTVEKAQLTAAGLLDQSWPAHVGLHANDFLVATHDCYGNFGNGFTPRPSSDYSFDIVPEDSTTYLFGGTLWVGGIVNGDTLVSTGADGWVSVREMFPDGDPPQPAVTRILAPAADYSLRALLTDTNTTLTTLDPFDWQPHQPLNIRIASRSHTWEDTASHNFVVYDLVLTNIGETTINDGYVGLYFDADVCWECSDNFGFQDDLAGFLSEDSIAYIIDNDGDLEAVLPEQPTIRSFNFRLLESALPLAHISFNWWISNGNPEMDFGPRERPGAGLWPEPLRDFGTGGTGTPMGDANKYYLMRNREIDYDQFRSATIDSTDTLWMPREVNFVDFASGYDTRFLASYGPFTLQPGESNRILFTTYASDTVHSNPDNLQNLPLNPDAYAANLDFTSVIADGALADSLAQLLLDPLLPPVGVHAALVGDSSVDITWDPWVYPEVTGYRLYLGIVPPGYLPYPGVISPWIDLDVYEDVIEITDPAAFEQSLAGLDPHQMYFVKLSHITAGSGEGGQSPPVFFKPGGRQPGPVVPQEYVFSEEGQPVTLAWQPADYTVDHYNVYRFADTAAARHRFHAFWDSAATWNTIDPVDSWAFGADTFYYYATPTFSTVPGTDTSFTDNEVVEGHVYCVTAVDQTGFESAFSGEVEVVVKPPRSGEVLVVSHGAKVGPLFMNWDSTKAFYDRILRGYDYAVYDWSDSINSSCSDGIGCVDWHDFMKYDLVIIDDDLTENVLNQAYVDGTGGYTRTLLAGTRLACFGSFAHLMNLSPTMAEAAFYEVQHPFIRRFFGVDSLFFVGAGYFYTNGLPKVDTIFGFTRAETTDSTLYSAEYDSLRNPFTSFERQLWPAETPPSVAVFDTTGEAAATHLYRALPGVTAALEGLPVGIRSEVEPGCETLLFGFHLWYLKEYSARGLINDLIPGECCQIRGNADGTETATAINVADLTFLVSTLFRGGPYPPCFSEGDADASGDLNIADVTVLVDYLFKGGAPLPPCP